MDSDSVEQMFNCEIYARSAQLPSLYSENGTARNVSIEFWETLWMLDKIELLSLQQKHRN